MRKSKKGLLLAGSIVGIVSAVLMLISCMFLGLFTAIFSEQLIYDTYANDPAYEIVEEYDGSYIIYDAETGEELFTEEDIVVMVQIPRMIIGMTVGGLSAFAIILMIFGILVLVNTCRDKSNKGPIITLLVFGALMGELLVVGLMIAGLCIKDKPEELPEEDIVVEPTKPNTTPRERTSTRKTTNKTTTATTPRATRKKSIQ